MKQLYTYCDKVLANTTLHGEYERKAVQRFLKDLETAKDKGFEFIERRANMFCEFFKMLNHSKGAQFAGKPFILSDWQVFIIANLFGWYKADGRRRFTEAYIEVAKKAGKSTLGAGVGMAKMILEGESRAEIYTAATTRDQARIILSEAQNMVRKSPAIRDDEFMGLKVYQHSIFSEFTASTFQALSADADTLEGKNPFCSIIDEYHAHKTDEVYSNLKTAMGARVNPLHFVITTAGFNKLAPCFRHSQIQKKMLSGLIEDESLFAIIFTIDEADDWENPAVWQKSNPNMGISVDFEFLESQYTAAKNNADKLVPFLTKHLNCWTDAARVWIPDEDWMKCKCAEIDLSGQVCYGGLDLASAGDTNSLALVFPQAEGFCLKVWYWIPEAAVKRKKTVAAYEIWVRNGHIKINEGNIIDHRVMLEDIAALNQQYKIHSIAYDRWIAYHGVVQGLLNMGIDVFEFGQGYQSMSEPTKSLYNNVLSGGLQHFGDPVTRWMLSNVHIVEDDGGNIKVSKGKSHQKVDGVVSAIMAIGNMMRVGANASAYENRGILTL